VVLLVFLCDAKPLSEQEKLRREKRAQDLQKKQDRDPQRTKATGTPLAAAPRAAGAPPLLQRFLWGNATPAAPAPCRFALPSSLDVGAAAAAAALRPGNGSASGGFYVARLTGGGHHAVVRGAATAAAALAAAEREASAPGAPWRPSAVEVRRLYGRAAAGCDARDPAAWHGARARLSFGGWQRYFPCAVDDDLGGIAEVAGEVAWPAPARAMPALPPCRFDGRATLGAGAGSARSGAQPLFLPAACRAPPRPTLEARLKARKLLVVGDSVSKRFHDGLSAIATTADYFSINENVGAPNNDGVGVGLGWFFAERPPFDATPLDPDKLELHPENWPAFLKALRKTDLAVLNSGLHDVAPLHRCEGLARCAATGSACAGAPEWHGDKGAVVAHYAARLSALFRALGAANVTAKVLWRTTTYPGFLYRDHLKKLKPMRGSQWYYRCDTQHLRVDVVDALNGAAARAAEAHGVALWDVSPMALAMKAEHFNDIVHPTTEYARTWALFLATFDGLLAPDRAAPKRKKPTTMKLKDVKKRLPG